MSEPRPPRVISIDDFAGIHRPHSSFLDFLINLPSLGEAQKIFDVRDGWLARRQQQQSFVLLVGSEAVSLGLSPLVIDLVQRGFIQAVAFSGNAMMSDLHVAMTGSATPPLDRYHQEGGLPLAPEVLPVLQAATDLVRDQRSGLGAAIASVLAELAPRHEGDSILMAARRFSLPITVHISLGDDPVHLLEDLRVEDLALGSLLDLSELPAWLDRQRKISWINLGSARLLPEVLNNTSSLLEASGKAIEWDMGISLLPGTQGRGQRLGWLLDAAGESFDFVGALELTWPLLCAALLEEA
ncbi:MAG: hypothetical protein COX57_10735 [Alphaproteobacteria bacterium CG_4_10_14_0_2_um_filter_63_37]|nr:MAG: hypothetical protein AUJ55_10685 [Proteobacteria bacterium CG1_02_64_396]PJA24058.1 MAG: hypothetical protein COX57_10735 [Alphaproteobacteria bacterium CG_4_10_14_0_2_um_filter_63_37]